MLRVTSADIPHLPSVNIAEKERNCQESIACVGVEWYSVSVLVKNGEDFAKKALSEVDQLIESCRHLSQRIRIENGDYASTA
jgi:hypothetical protein